MAESSSDESKVSRSIEGISKGVASMLSPSSRTDNNCGREPSELYGMHEWTITMFSLINKRELRSNTFEIGGYKWYLLIFPKGCDVSDHLSIFLCVDNHEKLPREWCHFAQFTIALVNKDPKKSKYSDTLHRFWKKEHDWGWKKYMELSRLSDGYADYDTLVIKAQVQVISFCRFWSGIDQKSRDNMSREKSDSILPKVVKHFFIEKEVTSTLMMESLCMGLTALKEPSMPIVRMEEGSFVLVDDLLLLLEREAIEPLTPKDGYSGEFSIENVEKCLTKLRRRTIEIYVLAHILSKTEVAYQETVPYALNLQEEVIRE